ncbi:LacI family DNA-binding transcriptional regulator [Actinoallomurus bryophytorum]|uniref:LacI family transcriptional regulator n=1 Tax=Actinoallomurus bryophytorum TaxID=1490222 RepID=A0A543CSW8_9ACTN|nr:LacI family DNA-binding transcriptional regulator [Actinoallomurus bryophytorum]TQM00111.1 LacI family transcriptional regulator [Actinoallomurus bryophytorum]
MSKRPTSHDVARAAGVSQSTVSLVLAGKAEGRVKPETGQAVREAARRLGYRPNLAARNLRLGRTRTVLLVVPTLASPFFGAVYTGAARVAGERGFGVVVHPWTDDAAPARSPVDIEAIDGVLASSLGGGVTGMGDVPLVVLDNDPADPAPSVNFDVAGGMRLIARHLAELGHRRIGHLAAAVDAWTFRVRGEVLADAGPLLCRGRSAIDVTAARTAALALLDRGDRPSALVCDDDLIAAGAYKAARALGLEVPADLSVTGFDDILVATALEPELTTIRLPAEELGARAMTALLERLDGQTPPDVSLPGELIVRGSTAPPREA